MHHTFGVEFILCEIFLNHDYEVFTNRECILLDVGMNFGTTALYFAHKSNVKNVYSFEPFAPTCQEAIRNIRLNSALECKITVYPFGLGLKNETIEVLYDKRVAGGMSTVLNRFDGSDPIYKRERAVLEKLEVRNAFEALNPLVGQHSSEKIILKVDTEGAEFEIFKALDEGGLLRRIDVVMLEYHFRSPQELEDRLTSNGFFVFYKGQHKKGEKTGVMTAIRNE
jgi:FkbM family methyltransferase